MSTHLKSITALAAAELLPRVAKALTHPTAMKLVVLVLGVAKVIEHSSQG